MGGKRAHQLSKTRIRRVRPRHLKLCVDFDPHWKSMIVDESYRPIVIHEDMDFSVEQVERPRPKQALAIVREESSYQPTECARDATADSTCYDGWRRLRDQQDADEDFSLIIECKKERIREVIDPETGKLRIEKHPVSTEEKIKSFPTPQVEPKVRPQQLRLPPVEAPAQRQVTRISTASVTPQTLTERIRNSIINNNSQATLRRHIKEEQQRRVLAGFSIVDLVEQRARLPNVHRLSIRPSTRISAQSPIIPRRISFISPIANKARYDQRVSSIGSSTFAPPLASTPIDKRQGPRQSMRVLPFSPITSVLSKTQTSQKQSLTALPVTSPLAQNFKRRKTGSVEVHTAIEASTSSEAASSPLPSTSPQTETQKEDTSSQSSPVTAEAEIKEPTENEPSSSSCVRRSSQNRSVLGELQQSQVSSQVSKAHDDKDDKMDTAEIMNDEAEHLAEMFEHSAEISPHSEAASPGHVLQTTAAPSTADSQMTIGVNVDEFQLQSNASIATIGCVDPSMMSDATTLHGANNTQLTCAPRRNLTQTIDMEDNFDGLPFFLEGYTGDRDDFKELLYICGQTKPLSWDEALPADAFLKIVKLGEGSYGEVFATSWRDQPVALKIIEFVNPSDGFVPETEFKQCPSELIPETVISKEVSHLSKGAHSRTPSFIGFHEACIVKGGYPVQFLAAWDKYAKTGKSENDRPPDDYETNRLFLLIAQERWGKDVEFFKPATYDALISILLQLLVALMVAETELSFEHRDLHVGNVLVKETKSKAKVEREVIDVCFNDVPFKIRTFGVTVKIIDFTNSRLQKAGVNMYLDLAQDEDLFKGTGNYQFDIYRMMRDHNKGNWADFAPKTNVFWLHYMFKSLFANVQKHDAKRKRFISDAFESLLKYECLGDFLRDMSDNLFQGFLVE